VQLNRYLSLAAQQHGAKRRISLIKATQKTIGKLKRKTGHKWGKIAAENKKHFHTSN